MNNDNQTSAEATPLKTCLLEATVISFKKGFGFARTKVNGEEIFIEMATCSQVKSDGNGQYIADERLHDIPRVGDQILLCREVTASGKHFAAITWTYAKYWKVEAPKPAPRPTQQIPTRPKPEPKFQLPSLALLEDQLGGAYDRKREGRNGRRCDDQW